MSVIREGTLEGLNGFIADQKTLPGEALLTLVQFDHEYMKFYDQVPIAEAGLLEITDFAPRGSTALLDSIARLVDETGERLRNMDPEDRPGRVVVVIVTDGYENASQEYNVRLDGYQRIKEKIQHQESVYSWDFIFLGANIDVEAEQSRLGVSNAFAYEYHSEGAVGAFASASLGIGYARDGGAVYTVGGPNPQDMMRLKRSMKNFEVDSLAVPSQQTISNAPTENK